MAKRALDVVIVVLFAAAVALLVPLARRSLGGGWSAGFVFVSPVFAVAGAATAVLGVLWWRARRPGARVVSTTLVAVTGFLLGGFGAMYGFALLVGYAMSGWQF